MIKYFLAVITLSTFTCALSLYGPKDNIVDLTDSNFDMMVLKDNTSFWMVEFYSPFCGRCKQFSTEYKKVAKALHGILKIGAVNADEYRYLSTSHGISNYPTIFIFDKNHKKMYAKYDGKYNAKDLIKFGKAAVI